MPRRTHLRRLAGTFLSKPAEVHAVVGGVTAALSDRAARIVALAFGEADPRTPLEADIQSQAWYSLGALALTWVWRRRRD